MTDRGSERGRERAAKELRISSADNALFRDLKLCLDSKGVRKLGLFLLSGRKTVAEYLKKHGDRSVYVVASPEMEFDSPHFARVVRLEKPLFKELDIFGTHAPLVVGKVPEILEWDPKSAPQGLELLCALGEPSNVGALMRSAAAFGISKIVLLKESATPFHPKALRASSGTTFSIPLTKGPSIHDLGDLPLLALDMKGEPLSKFNWPKNTRLLLGEEGPGLPDLKGLQRLRIEMRPGIESLNATIAASLAFYSYRLKHSL